MDWEEYYRQSKPDYYDLIRVDGRHFIPSNDGNFPEWAKNLNIKQKEKRWYFFPFDKEEKYPIFYKNTLERFFQKSDEYYHLEGKATLNFDPNQKQNINDRVENEEIKECVLENERYDIYIEDDTSNKWEHNFALLPAGEYKIVYTINIRKVFVKNIQTDNVYMINFVSTVNQDMLWMSEYIYDLEELQEMFDLAEEKKEQILDNLKNIIDNRKTENSHWYTFKINKNYYKHWQYIAMNAHNTKGHDGKCVIKYIGGSTKVNIPNKIDNKKVVATAPYAFYKKHLKEVHFPNYLYVIGYSSFSFNKIKKIDLSNTKVDSIHYKAFESNEITKVIGSNNLKEIGMRAFQDNNIKKRKDLDINFDNVKINKLVFCCNPMENDLNL